MQSGDSVSVKLIQPRNGDEWQSILSRWTQTVMHGSLSEKHAGATGVQGHGECARYYVCTWETCRGPHKVWELNPTKRRDPNTSAGVGLFHSSKEVCESGWSEGNSK